MIKLVEVSSEPSINIRNRTLPAVMACVSLPTETVVGQAITNTTGTVGARARVTPGRYNTFNNIIYIYYNCNSLGDVVRKSEN